MLALLPSMGSSKPPNLEMPFGYSFDNNNDFSFAQAPALPPGRSLLDDDETKHYSTWLDGFESENFEYDIFSNGPNGFAFDTELPPTFVGTSSSFGQQPLTNPGIPEMNYGEMHTQIPIPLSIPPTTSADVLAAAAFLSNVPNGRSHSIGGGMHQSQLAMQPPSAQVRPHSISEQSHSRPLSNFQHPLTGPNYMENQFYNNMIYGSQSQDALRQQRLQTKVDIQWGSDVAFANAQGFVPPASQHNVAASERSHLKAVEQAFTLNTVPLSSADTTRPSTPVRRQERISEPTAMNDNKDGDSRPRKRRKSRYKEEEEEEEDEEEDEAPPTTSKSSGKKRKSTKKGSDQSPGPETEPTQGHKRRKSTIQAPKPSRENLTEHQKRENHIKSEQKRRTLIREGFEDLNVLVPDLGTGGFSKSAVLTMTADFLEGLIAKNQILRARLAQMEAD